MVLKILISVSLLLILIFLREFSIRNKKSLEMAENLFKKGKVDKVKKILSHLIKNKNLNEASKAMSLLGRVYYFENKYEDATEIFKYIYNMEAAKKIIKMKSLHFLSLIAEKEEKYDLAIKYAIKFQESKERTMPVERVVFEKQVFIILARCYFYKGDDHKAIECLKKCLDGAIDENDEGRIKMQLGRFYLELGNYMEAEKYFEEIEKKSLAKTERTLLNYHLSMLFLGKNDYKSLSRITNEQDFLQGATKDQFFGLYSSVMADIENGVWNKAKEKSQKIFKIIENLNVDAFYKFFYYTILAYYGLAKLELANNNLLLAEENFRKMEVALEKIAEIRFDSFIQRVNINFLKILVFDELAELYYVKKDVKRAKDKIEEIDVIIKNLTEKEKLIIEHKEIGNRGSVFKKSNILKMKLNEKD